ncbi:MAG: hypothetical protein AB7O29_09585 [Acidimicrobiia bacterium]
MSALLDAGVCFARLVPPTDIRSRFSQSGDSVLFSGGECSSGIPAAERPRVRAINLVDGTISTIAGDSFSPVVSPSGRLAYARGSGPITPADGPRWTTEVMVVIGGVTESWTDPGQSEGRYQPLAWAGDTLITRFEFAASGYAELRVLRGPDDETRLEDSFLHAVSPGGSHFLVNEDPLRDFIVLYEATTLQRVATISYHDWLAVAAPGKDLPEAFRDSRVPFDPPTGGSLTTSFTGEWLDDDRIVLNADGLAVIRVHSNRTAMELERRVPIGAAPSGIGATIVVALTPAGPNEIAVRAQRITYPSAPVIPVNPTPEQVQSAARGSVPSSATEDYLCNIEIGSCEPSLEDYFDRIPGHD